MSIWITEYAGYGSGRPFSQWPTEPAIQTQLMSGASTTAQTTSTLSAQTRAVALRCDVPMFVAFGSSTSSTANGFSSTNSQRLLANVDYIRNVSPSARIIASST
jgi:hypothetical protein